MHFHRQKERKKIIQSTNRALFNLVIIFPLSNLTYAFGAQDNESLARSCWAASWYIYIKYVLDWCTLPILSRWTTDRYVTIVRLFDSYIYTNLSLTRILTVNILLRALKSFNTIYNSIYIYICMQIEHFSHSCNFLIQIHFTSNCLKSLKTNHFKHK